MTTDPMIKPQRLQVVDALRGFALLAIVLLHNLEHYNLFCIPEWEPQWLLTADKYVWDIVFFFFAGNAYATFSLLFGFSFFIQMRNARRRGEDFRGRFAWRMLLLAGFAQLHALFYNGDILLLYAVCGLILIPASGWKDRTVLIVAMILMAQPYACGKIIYALFNPEYVDTNSLFIKFAVSAEEVGRDGNFFQTVANNIWNGQLYSNFWQVEAGRLFQTPALFLLGMWLGRKSMFEKTVLSVAFWKKLAVIALVAAIPLYFAKELIPPHLDNITILSYYSIAIGRIYNFALTSVLVGAFVLLWFYRGTGYRLQRALIPYGRMSLTNYIGQSILGVAIYYHWGLGLYEYCGAAISEIIALGIFVIQLMFSRYWLRTHAQGPLEYLWKRGTWLQLSHQTKISRI